jgi:DNA-binding MarR family transcriptional regulator
MVERALVRIRRDQQARRLQRQTGEGEQVPGSAADGARFRYLDALDEATEGMAISEIAEAIGVDRPRASRLTIQLLDDELIERDTNPSDSRYALIRLTVRGREIVNAMHESRRHAVAEATAAFTPEETRTFAALLERFVDAWPRNPT